MQRALNARLTCDDYAAIPSDGRLRLHPCTSARRSVSNAIPTCAGLDCYHNVDGTFVQSAAEAGAECLLSPDFEGLTIDLAAIWR